MSSGKVITLSTGAVTLEVKEERLREALAELPSLIIALSGGTDSAYLAWVADSVLGERALAVTAVSASLPERERDEVAEFVERFGIAHEFIRTEELANPRYVANNPDRCYHCKDELFTVLDRLAQERGFAAVAYGVNVDDQGDFRPGQQAAREHRVLTPLLDAGLTKAEIRELSRRAGLPTWSKPAAACLASRIAYGIAVTEDILKQVERGEEALRRLGFRQVRVRYHGSPDAAKAGQPSRPERSRRVRVDSHAHATPGPLGPEGLVRIEIAPDELPRALNPEMAARIRDAFKSLGFRYITLDLEGYRQGSFNPQK